MWTQPKYQLDEEKAKAKISVLMFPSNEVLYLALITSISQILCPRMYMHYFFNFSHFLIKVKLGP